MNQWHEFIVHPQIIPTVLIPLTAVAVAISSLAVFIAGLFGIKLKADGPKKLLEVLLKPKVLIAAFLTTGLFWSGAKGYEWLKNRASFDLMATYRQNRLAKVSNLNYPDVVDLMPLYSFKLRANTTANFKLEPNWKIRLPSGSFSEPTISGTSLFVGSEDGLIYEIDKRSGQQIRQFFVGTPVTPRVLVHQGYLYAGEGTHDIHHARVSKFDLKTGKYVGSFQTLGHIEGQLALDDQSGKNPLILASGGSGGLYAIDPKNLALVWNVNIGHSDTGARVDGDIVFFGTGREKNTVDSSRSWAVAVKRTTGEILWQRELPASSWMLPTLRRNEACFTYGEVYFKSDLGGIACFEKNTGKTVSMYFHTAPIVSDPILINDDFVFTDFFGKTCRVDSSTQLTKWCQQFSEEKYTFAGLRYDLESQSIVKATRKALIAALDPETGRERLRWQLTDKPGKAFAPAAVDGQDWYFIDLEGNLTALTKAKKNFLSVRQ